MFSSLCTPNLYSTNLSEFRSSRHAAIPRQALQDELRFSSVFFILIEQIVIARIITKDAHEPPLTSKCGDDIADAVDVRFPQCAAAGQIETVIRQHVRDGVVALTMTPKGLQGGLAVHPVEEKPGVDTVVSQMGDELVSRVPIVGRDDQPVHPVDAFAAGCVLLEQDTRNGTQTERKFNIIEN